MTDEELEQYPIEILEGVLRILQGQEATQK